MKQKIKVGIVGYGNLGKGAELAIGQSSDMELVAIFSRRKLTQSASNVPCVPLENIEEYIGKIDVMILCGGSATDLVEQGPMIAEKFNTVDSFDNHSKIPEYFSVMDKVAKGSGKSAIISVGWDPGLFSLNRLLGNIVLPNGKDTTFWGKGISQGHSDALRRIDGVKNAKQYTIPRQEYMDAVRNGETVTKPGNELHIRECFVVPHDGADLMKIETDIRTMPGYFVGYETIVHFISEQELEEKHGGIPHGGFVFRSGETKTGTKHVMEFALKLDSNPEFTSSVLVAYARALYRLSEHGASGAFTVFDIPFAWLSPQDPMELRRLML